jgi:hypothetical protein
MLSLKQKTLLGTGGGLPTGQIPTGNKYELSTSKGLYNLAVDSGFQKDADRVMETQSGEDVNKIFSGGFISDVFDALNALQYGVTGMLKGKSFIEGVKTRQSFSDKDALGDKGLPGVIGGIIADIAVDPLTYIAPWTIAKKVPLVSKLAKAGKEAIFGKRVVKTVETGVKATKEVPVLEGGTKVGRYFANKLVYAYGAGPEMKDMLTRNTASIAIGTKNIVNITKKLAKIPNLKASKLLTKDETGRFIRTPLEELKKTLGEGDFNAVSEAWKSIDDLGKEAVNAKLLTKEKFEENFGEYIKNAYTEYEKAKNKGLFSWAKRKITPIKARKEGLTKEKMIELGQIDDPAYLFFKSSLDILRSTENAKLFNTIKKGYAVDIAQEGFKQLPKTAGLGELAGKYIPENIFDYVQEISEPMKYGIGKKLMGDFKFFKVVMNPATHARNIISNQILNWWKLGMNPLDPRVFKSNATALREISKKSGKWMDEAKKIGYDIDTFAANELRHLFDLPEANAAMGKLGKNWSKVKTKLGDVYQGEENFAKLSAYIFNKTTKKLSPENAWKAAEAATFNYAQVTPFIRKMRTALFGFPFITFTTKATPLAAETMLKYPRRVSVFGKIKNSLEDLADIKETERERASEAPWVRDGFYIKLPMKDKYDRSAYFDLTYIIPFGDLMSGQFLERKVSTETGLKESLPLAAMSQAPAINLLKEIGHNQDFYGNSIWKESDDSAGQLQDLFRHMLKTYLPPLVSDQIPGGYNAKGERQQRGIIGATQTPEDEIRQKRTLQQEIMRNAGLKIQPVNVDIQEDYQEWNRKKALEMLLREKGVVKDFSSTYIPK